MAKKPEGGASIQVEPIVQPVPERTLYAVRLIVMDSHVNKAALCDGLFPRDVTLLALSDVSAGQIAKNRELLRRANGAYCQIWDVALDGQDLEPWTEAVRVVRK